MTATTKTPKTIIPEEKHIAPIQEAITYGLQPSGGIKIPTLDGKFISVSKTDLRKIGKEVLGQKTTIKASLGNFPRRVDNGHSRRR